LVDRRAAVETVLFDNQYIHDLLRTFGERRRPGMPERYDVATSDLGDLARRILDGTFELRRGCVLEISTFAWNNNDRRDQQAFVNACQRKGVRHQVVSQIGGVIWVCPDKAEQ
jgi:hypothetical protein